jgi:iron complex outermembrane receptor protein
MGWTRLRWYRRLRLAALAAVLVSSAAHAQLGTHEFNIAAQDAPDALAEFGEQSGLQLLFDYEAVEEIRTAALAGPHTVPDALNHMLAGTGLTFVIVNDRTISIRRAPRTPFVVGAPTTAGAAGSRRSASLRDARDQDFRGAGVAATIDEITVTAEKRDQALQRSALAVTALPARVLERQQVTDLKSVTTLIPNLQIGTSSTQAAFDLALRGIVSTNRTEIGDAAVAFHVDGFYSPRPQGATMLIHDMDRLEALRGPQGTLFGRNANAGVINVVTAKPELGATFGAIDLTLGDYDLRRLKGHVNLPVGETLALRASAFAEQRDGYIEFLPGSDVAPSTPRYDDSDKLAVRLSSQWQPNDAWTVFASAERYADRGAGTIPVSLEPTAGHGLRSALITSPGELDMKNDTSTCAPICARRGWKAAICSDTRA